MSSTQAIVSLHKSNCCIIMRTISVAVIGVGYWGPNLIRNFTRIPQVKSIVACDIDKKRLRTITNLYPQVRTSQNFDEVLRDKEIALVAIATPVNTHYQLAKKALLAGKHVMVEKPLTKTVAQAKELLDIAQKKKRLLFAGHTFVYNPAVKKMKQFLKEGRLGKIYYYESTRANLGLIQNDTNVVWDLAPHDFSILLYIFRAKPLTLRVISSRHVHAIQDEVAHIFIRFEENIMAHIHLSWLSPVKIRTIMLAGSKKMLLYDELNHIDKIRIYDKGVSVKATQNSSFPARYRYGNILVPNIEESEPLYNELNHFVTCILKKKKPLTGGIEGLAVVKMLEAAELSVKTGKEILLM